MREEQSSKERSGVSVFTNFMVPYQRNAYFTGREKLLALLHTELSRETTNRWNHRLAIYGLGGVGKTQLALEYAYSQRENYNGVYWLSAVSQATLFSGFQEIAIQTSCITQSPTLKPSELAAQVLRWLNRDQKWWLLVIDNLEDVSVVDGYLPDFSNGHTLITTRNQHYDQIPAEGLEIGILDVDDAINLLLTRARIFTNEKTFEKTNEVAGEIARELGCLPLAIEQAAGYIREASKDIYKFLPSYRQNRKNHHARISKGNRKYYSESVATTWRLSFNQIEHTNNDASKLLQLLAFLNPDGILMDFLEAGVTGFDDQFAEIIGNTDRLCEALAELQRFSLIRRQLTSSDGQHIIVHRLVQSVVKDEMPSKTASTIHRAVIGLCNSGFPEWHDWDQNLLHQSRLYEDQVVGPLLAMPQVASETLGCLLSRVGLYLREEGKYQQADEVLGKSQKLFEELKGSEDHETLNAKALLAWSYQDQGNYQKAAELEEQVLETRLKLFGDEHPDTLEIMATLARTYRTQARYHRAAQLKEHVLEVRRKLGGEEHPETLMAMGYLAHTYRDQGQLEKAADLEEKVVEARTRLFDKEHPSTLLAMGNLGSTYRAQGRFGEAAELEEKVFEATMRLLGKEHPETLLAMMNLGCTFREQGKLRPSIILLERAVEGRRLLGGNDHPGALWAQFNLAVAYQKKGEHTTSIKLLQDTEISMKKVLGEDHPWTLSAMHSLALGYQKEENLAKSRAILERVIFRRKKILGENHPNTIESLKALGFYNEEL